MAVETAIPKRQVFKPAEVCSIAGVQPYILRSWEAEFSTLARPKKKGGARVYRRADVEMVLQIKELVFGEGLTLGAARRKLEADRQPPTEDAVEVESDTDIGDGGLLVGLFEADHLRDRLEGVKQGLRDVLAMLSSNGDAHGAVKAVTDNPPEPRSAPKAASGTTKAKGSAKATKTTKTTRTRKSTKSRRSA